MFLPIILLALMASAQSAILPIRAGVNKLQMGNLNEASYTINFKTELNDNSYNSLVSVSYVQYFNNANGIIVNSACSSYTQTGMGCTIKSNNENKYKIIYMSYIVSDTGSLFVGSYQKTFKFTGQTNQAQTLVFKPSVDSNSINLSNSLFVELYLFIASIQSYDSLFSLNIDSQDFNQDTLSVSLGVSLKQFDRDVSVTFGYMLFDASAITITLYEGQSLTPGRIASGYFYAIRAIRTAPSPPNRLLQIYKRPSIRHINSSDEINIYPDTRNSTAKKPQPGSQSQKYNIETPSQTAEKIRSGHEGTSQLKFKNVYLNPRIFSSATQTDGIIDTNSSTLAALRKIGFFQPDKTLSTSLSSVSTVSPVSYVSPVSSVSTVSSVSPVSRKVVPHSHRLVEATAAAAPPIFVPPVAPQQVSEGSGVDNNMFNNLFSTNGFVIMTTSTDIDLIYFYEVDPVQNIPTDKGSGKGAGLMMAPESLVFYRSIVNNRQAKVTCQSGQVKVGRHAKIDYIQSKMIIDCVGCTVGFEFDRQTKSCRPSPWWQEMQMSILRAGLATQPQFIQMIPSK